MAGTGLEFPKKQDAAVTVSQSFCFFGAHQNLGHGHQRVFAPLPGTAVGADTPAADLDGGCRSHQRACLYQHLTFGDTGPYMHAKYRGCILRNSTGCNHLHRTGHTLFRRLEQKTDILGQYFFPQFLRCCQQHSHVGIMTAGMHNAGILGSIGHSCFLHHRKGIHIRPQQHPGKCCVHNQIRIHTGFSDPHGGVSHPDQSLHQKICRLIFLSGQFRMGMEVLIAFQQITHVTSSQNGSGRHRHHLQWSWEDPACSQSSPQCHGHHTWHGRTSV